MKILKSIVIFIVVVLVLLFIGSFFISGDVHVERSEVINAPASVIFDQVNTLPKNENWSPWAAMEPDADFSYGDPESGEGATYSWEGEKIGKGTLTITESVPNSLIKTDVTFEGQGEGKGTWTFEETDEGVNVTWGFDSEMDGPVAKYMGLMMDGMLGPEFEKGLAKLKEIAESAPAEPEVDATGISQVVLEPRWVVAVRDTTTISGLGAEMMALYPQLPGMLAEAGIEIGGNGVSLYHLWDEENDMVVYEAGFFVADSVDVPDDLNLTKVEGSCLKTTHYGPYEGMEATYENLMSYIESNTIQPVGFSIEEYTIAAPEELDSTKWVTDIYFQI